MGEWGMLIGQCRYPPCTLSRWMEVKADLQSISSGSSLRVVYYEVLSEDRPKRENLSVISSSKSHSLFTANDGDRNLLNRAQQGPHLDTSPTPRIGGRRVPCRMTMPSKCRDG